MLLVQLIFLSSKVTLLPTLPEQQVLRKQVSAIAWPLKRPLLIFQGISFRNLPPDVKGLARVYSVFSKANQGCIIRTEHVSYYSLSFQTELSSSVAVSILVLQACPVLGDIYHNLTHILN